MKNNKLSNTKDAQQYPAYLFHQGTNYRAYDFMGAHIESQNNKKGVCFRTWAPNAQKVSVVGDFNNWDINSCIMHRITDGGIFELFIEGVKEFDAYKFAITYANKTVLKADPYAFYSETPSLTASKIYEIDGYSWQDADYIKEKKTVYDKPMNIYEVNLASWKKHSNGDYYSYRELQTIRARLQNFQYI